MRGQLVRMPDPFRPSRSTPTAATPTCCCCCCCCVATLVTSSIVLPMRVELRGRRLGEDARPPGMRNLKTLAGLAPWIALAVALGVAIALTSLPLFVLVSLVVLYALLAVADPLPTKWRDASVPTLAFGVAFAVEFVGGAILVLTTAGIGYLILGVLGSWLVTRAFNRKLRPVVPPAA